MGPSADTCTVEPVLAGFLGSWFLENFPGMYRESSEPILMQILLLLPGMEKIGGPLHGF